MPTTAKLVQEMATEANPAAVVVPHTLGASVCGVITTAILTRVYVALLR